MKTDKNLLLTALANCKISANPKQIYEMLNALNYIGARRVNLIYACGLIGVVGSERLYKELRRLEKECS